MVEPLDPFQRRQLHRLKMAPGAASANDLGLVQSDGRFRERVVIAVANASDGGLDAGLNQPLRIPDREVLGGFKRSSQHGFVEGIISNPSDVPGSGVQTVSPGSVLVSETS